MNTGTQIMNRDGSYVHICIRADPSIWHQGQLMSAGIPAHLEILEHFL